MMIGCPCYNLSMRLPALVGLLATLMVVAGCTSGEAPSTSLPAATSTPLPGPSWSTQEAIDAVQEAVSTRLPAEVVWAADFKPGLRRWEVTAKYERAEGFKTYREERAWFVYETSGTVLEAGNTSTEIVPTLVEAVVVGVIDGNTIDVLIDGQEHRVRYLGIDAPDVVYPTHVERFAVDAWNGNELLVGSQTVYLEKDVSQSDEEGRLLRYVWLEDGEMVNAILVEAGLARTYIQRPDIKYYRILYDMEELAMDFEIGVFSNPSMGRYASYGDCVPSYPDVCIPLPPPELSCDDIPYRNFTVLPPDLHGFDDDKDGVGCQD